MVGVSRGAEIIQDAGARKLQVFALLVALDLLGSLRSRSSLLLRGRMRFHLGFDILAFPTTCHTYSLTQNELNARQQAKKFKRK